MPEASQKTIERITNSMATAMLFGLKCEGDINRIDPLLDDPGFIDSLFNKSLG
jgi:hypothetical protein